MSEHTPFAIAHEGNLPSLFFFPLRLHMSKIENAEMYQRPATSSLQYEYRISSVPKFGVKSSWTNVSVSRSVLFWPSACG